MGNPVPLPIMIFAAGFGTRMGALTKTKPKPMIEVAGKPLIDHALDHARAAECDPVAINLHYKPETLRAHLTGQNIRFSEETDQILDTGGGLKAALPLLERSPLATLNPDVIWSGPNPITVLQSHWQPERMDALLLCVPITRTIGRLGEGDFSSDTQGRGRRGGSLVYGGAQILKTDGLEELSDTVFSLNCLWNRLIADNRLYVCEYPGHWCDVGRPECIPLAENLLEQCDV